MTKNKKNKVKKYAVCVVFGKKYKNKEVFKTVDYFYTYFVEAENWAEALNRVNSSCESNYQFGKKHMLKPSDYCIPASLGAGTINQVIEDKNMVTCYIEHADAADRWNETIEEWDE